MEELKPCDCGGDVSDIIPIINRETRLYCVWCMECNEMTEYYQTEKEAIEAWNRRTQNDSCE